MGSVTVRDDGCADSSDGAPSIISLSLSVLRSIVGYLAETPEEYASAILHVVRDCNGSSSSQAMITRRGKASAKRFSDEIFSAAFVNACEACQ
jgi:hypothetical protein